MEFYISYMKRSYKSFFLLFKLIVKYISNLVRRGHIAGAHLAVPDDLPQVALAVPAVNPLAESHAALLTAVAPLSVLSHALVVEQSQLGRLLFRDACICM